MKKIAIIPARGGSKRIPKKNIKSFLGKPIIAYSILAALESGLYDEVMVTTDCDEIAETAVKYGARTPFIRSRKNSSDVATTVDVLVEVLNWYRDCENTKFDLGTCIYACAPFVNSVLLNQSVILLEQRNADCVFPAVAYSHPIQRAFEMKGSGNIVPFTEGDSEGRTQDLAKTYHDAGMFYTFQVEKLITTKSLRTSETFAIAISELQAQDIDTPEDWFLAEMKYRLFGNEKL